MTLFVTFPRGLGRTQVEVAVLCAPHCWRGCGTPYNPAPPPPRRGVSSPRPPSGPGGRAASPAMVTGRWGVIIPPGLPCRLHRGNLPRGGPPLSTAWGEAQFLVPPQASLLVRRQILHLSRMYLPARWRGRRAMEASILHSGALRIRCPRKSP